MRSFKRYKNFLNENKYLTFDDLVFMDALLFDFTDSLFTGKQAKINFDNGYKASVLLGKCYYSNGIDTYEMMCMDENGYNIYDDVFPYLSKSEVTEKMIQLQKRKAKKRYFTPEDPYGEEVWDDEIFENVSSKEKITTVQLWNQK